VELKNASTFAAALNARHESKEEKRHKRRGSKILLNISFGNQKRVLLLPSVSHKTSRENILKIISQNSWRNKNLITFALPFCKGKIGKKRKVL